MLILLDKGVVSFHKNINSQVGMKGAGNMCSPNKRTTYRHLNFQCVAYLLVPWGCEAEEPRRTFPPMMWGLPAAGKERIHGDP